MKIILTLIFLCISALGSTTNEIVLEINNKVSAKYPDLNIPNAWETRVFIKYYPDECSIKVHCPVESDAPFGRVLIRNLFRIYKHKFPTDNHISKMKLSFQSPVGDFITAKELSDKGYLPTLNELVENLIEEDTRNDLPSASSSILPMTKLSLSSLSSSVSNVHNYPIYIFHTNEDEKLKQEGMVQLLVQLGFNVIHIHGNPPIAVEPSNIPSGPPEIISPITGYNKTLDDENADI
ncbi:putative signal peptide protein [Cryptosporidium canis]|uniref:Signal peptide protein n=1 Tax=Cryptosporidium canis TaxID=195482 RepID=A0A9D5DFW1_9CRYT|nr:putative signal peptide protein [Cryptosporidium canis]